MSENEEKLKGLLMRVKEDNESVILKLNIKKYKKKTNIIASGHITSWPSKRKRWK